MRGLGGAGDLAPRPWPVTPDSFPSLAAQAWKATGRRIGSCFLLGELPTLPSAFSLWPHAWKAMPPNPAGELPWATWEGRGLRTLFPPLAEKFRSLGFHITPPLPPLQLRAVPPSPFLLRGASSDHPDLSVNTNRAKRRRSRLSHSSVRSCRRMEQRISIRDLFPVIFFFPHALIEFIGVTLVDKIIQVPGAHFCNT